VKRILWTAAALGLSAGSALAATGTTAVDRQIRSEGDRMTKALNLLEAKGDASFTNFRADGNAYRATVSQNGRSFDVRVDPMSGQVTPVG